MVKKRNSKRKHSQVKESINKSKLITQEAIDSPKIQSATITDQSVKDVNELQNVLETAVKQTETKIDKASVNGIAEVIESLPTLGGALDAFVSPNILRGWAFSHEGANLRVRIIAGSSILGETPVNITRPDLMHLNDGLTGWWLETECQLSGQEFLALAETIRVVILDESSNMIGQIPIWNKLLERLMAENSEALTFEEKEIA